MAPSLKDVSIKHLAHITLTEWGYGNEAHTFD